MTGLSPRPGLSRRQVLAGSGALVLAFSLWRTPAGAQEEAKVSTGDGPLPGSLEDFPFLDSWIRIGADNAITVFTGKAELGQGIKTALIQVAAEQLMVDPGRVQLITADTGRTPDEGFTAASHSMEYSGMAILHAAAEARHVLVRIAAERLGTDIAALTVEDGVVSAGGQGGVSYGELVSDERLHVRARGDDSLLVAPASYTVMGTPMPRVDIPGKLTGAPSYVHDIRLPGMVHARVVRPPVRGATLAGLDASGVESMPGVIRVVRRGDYLAVVAEGEYQAIKAMHALAASAQWQGGDRLPDPATLPATLRDLPADVSIVHRSGSAAVPGGGTTVSASYFRPYQMHGSIGPSCAVGHRDGDMLTVWTHTQGVYPDRSAIAEMLAMPEEQVRCIHVEGAGCYGHNGADDAAADAAIIASELPGRPVKVQWMREDEHGWEPYGSAMLMSAEGAVDQAGSIIGWTYDVWSTPHTTRPGPAGNLMPAWLLPERFQMADPSNIPQPAGGADRNAVPPYTIPNVRITEHFIKEMPIRVSALRSLGAYANVFASESFMDELAAAAGADPVAFRLRHTEDPRARDVMTAAAERFGWEGRERRPGRGYGFAYARYKNLAAYCALAVEIEVDASAGRIRVLRAAAAADSGQAVNPDGIRNQIEGGMVQSLSWTLYEYVRFTPEGVFSRDWASYPILRMPAAPGAIDVEVIDRPGERFLGTGEASQGPMAAAVANALADATGVRMRELPLSPDRVRAALVAPPVQPRG